VTNEQLIVDRDGSVATVRLNYPQRLNALSSTMTKELIVATRELGRDGEVRAVVITGEGRAFCSGADLGALQEPYLRGEHPDLSPILRDGYNVLIPLIAEMPKPVIAAINGVAAGAGVSLALACDLRVASEAAWLSLAFVKIGLIPDSGACYFLPRVVGTARALELALLSDRVDAATALQMGLVNRVVPPDQLASEAHAVAQRLAEMPTVAIAMTKRLFRETSSLTLAEAMEREAEVQNEAAATDDHVEGVLAFLQKRPPNFTGH
jgi:2-(1,2-epoxy-1,2-dihydrophenyl)acetyl-CoA isomerase